MTELLRIEQLFVKLQGKTILSDISLSLSAGDILGLVGPSGCGKTTLLNTIAGFIEQSRGELTVDNTIKISPSSMVAPEHRNIGMIFQDYALFPHLTIEQNIRFGIEKLAKAEQKTRVADLIELLQLNDLSQRFPHQLSGGQQQRVAIARALAPRPKLLLLDEPFSNIDARLRNELILEMRLLLKRLNITAIFVTHNKDEVFTFADQIAVMHHGTIIQTGKPVDVCDQPTNWQVADFLQLGSWLPLVAANQPTSLEKANVLAQVSFNSALGNINSEFKTGTNLNSLQLLLKPKFIELSVEKPFNAKVKHIAVTEHGYRYLLTSLENKAELAFKQLIFYSEEILSLGQQVAITIKPHKLMIYDKAEKSNK